MIDVRSVVDRVGTTLLHASYVPDKPRGVSDVVIAEPDGRTQIGSGDLVLAVAANTAADAVRLTEQCGAQEAAALLCKPPLAKRVGVQRAARQAGTALIEVRAGTSWTQLVLLLRGVLDDASDEVHAPEGEPGSADLFRMADAVAAVVDAPVTIEDANSRVLAYSARQDRTDPARVSTVMGRRIPNDVMAKFRSRGVFRDLSKGKQTIYVPEQPDGTLPRLIVPIRLGGELLGSMWAVVPGPVAEERAAAFADAGPVVALQLLRRRARAGARQARVAELLRGLLQGTGSSKLAAAEMDLVAGPYRVVAIDAVNAEAPDAEGVRLALAERIARGVGAPLVTEVDGLLYAIVPVDSWSRFREGLATERNHGSLVAGAGEPVGLAELPRSRGQADETLGLLHAGLVAGPVADHGQAWQVLTLHRLAVNVGSGLTELGPLESLRAHDSANGTNYVDTLYEWLRHPGDPRAAGEALCIHPNTLRYRMRKVLAITEIDLDDPDTRLALLAQLIALRWN
ncbi:DNA-binding PucR family transcriptional regulator [Tamaricihabitans halophyticus]|uniref:DNA-binding PucR family transcriptional regulator n=1 Tax=Tamaricihabitans halophyticus TaxID=1262583 RepID=A0A4R2QQC3_9PSEU|nr:helix-turn-helix domain-containing protein [Tamaricihabitans halophyticus]TCP51920.1 DNA-binding PucR family transcriptional regulator [Tamaricihabitans halophyticus]